MPSEINKPDTKDKHCTTVLSRGAWDSERQSGGAGAGGGVPSCCLVSEAFGKVGKVLKVDGDGGTAMGMYLMPLSCALTNG